MTPFERWWNRPTQLAGKKEVPLWQLLSDDRKTACDTAYMAGVNSTARRLEVAQRMADALKSIVDRNFAFLDNRVMGDQIEAAHINDGRAALAEWEATR